MRFRPAFRKRLSKPPLADLRAAGRWHDSPPSDGSLWSRQGHLIPAGAGTGIIAGEAVRSVCEACGIHDILTKSYGTNNPVTLVKATMNAVAALRTREDVAALRNLEPSDLIEA